MRGEGEVFLPVAVRAGAAVAVPARWHPPRRAARRRALYRELHEEVGLKRADVELVGRTGDWIRYRLPQKFVRRNRHPVCIGQKQRWFLLRLEA